MPRIRRLLIANRGEIALRILRTARAIGIESVVAHSEADAASLPVRLADGSVLLGPAAARESYLSVERILTAAVASRCDAVHPGYGFLSERAELAEAVERAGLIYVGPTADNVRFLGDKLEARRNLAGLVSVVPGETAALADPAALRAAAERIGYPLLLKAASGGGGRGIRRIASPADLEAAFRLSSSEAQGAFGAGDVFAEKFVERARHVEVQIVGDGLGGVRVYPERDCSLQRRYQKLFEETPCPVMRPDVLEKLLEAAARIGRAARYRGAGTVEFLLEESERFYFLEVNTRLQVEHPITEAVSGDDLVALQIAVAEGRSFFQAMEVAPWRGAAVELRINAEDPARGFRPEIGRVHAVRLPAGPGVRIDTALEEGLVVTPHYDSLLAKLIAFGPDRTTALRRLEAAGAELCIDGPATTLALLRPLLRCEEFLAGRVHTKLLEELLERPSFLKPDLEKFDAAALATVAAKLREAGSGPAAPFAPSVQRRPDGWSDAARLPFALQDGSEVGEEASR